MSKNIESPYVASYTLIQEQNIFFRYDIIPFVLFDALCLQQYLLPQPLWRQVQFLIETNAPEWQPYHPGVDFYVLAWLWLIVLGGASQIFLGLLCYWNKSLRASLQYVSVDSISDATHVNAVPPLHCGSAEICELSKSKSEISFNFQRIRFEWSFEDQTFRQLQFPVNLLIEMYLKHTGFNSDDDIKSHSMQYGNNELHMPEPDFWDIFQEHALAPFFLFQVFCMLLWCMDDYWKYSLVTLGMLVMLEVLNVRKRMTNMKEVREMRIPPCMVMVYRFGKWQNVISEDVFPSDIISLRRTGSDEECPVDAVLLAGRCVVNEALLTGESIPQMKDPLQLSPGITHLDTIATHKSCLVSRGTKIILSEGPLASAFHIPAPSDGGSIGYVLRTGYNTSQGNLLRTILFSTARVTVNNPEAFYFIGILLIFAIAAASYVMYWSLQDPDRVIWRLILNFIMIITSVVPPELPMELSLAVNQALLQLMRKSVFCTEAFRIPFAGAVEVCCFDKTGTLTSDAFLVQGLCGLDGEDKLLKASEIPLEAFTVIGGCHSLLHINRELAGDPLERASVEAVGWLISRHGTAENIRSKFGRIKIHNLHRFPFLSALKRMSCVVNVILKGKETCQIVSKGAPEVMKSRFVDLPKNYDEVHSHHGILGHRVLALGVKVLPKVLNSKLASKLKREDAECDLKFAGFFVFSCPMKPKSKSSIIQLKNSSHAVVMITGDHVLTACAVASNLRICIRPILTLLTEKDDGSGELYFSNDLRTENKPFVCTDKGLDKLCENFDLCLPGSSLEALQLKSQENAISYRNVCCIVRHTRVFARFSPTQKEFILTCFKDEGLTTLMCGDGTNDVGALKQAHVGVALISPEMAAAHEEAGWKRRDQQRKRMMRENYMKKMHNLTFEEIQERLNEEFGDEEDVKPVRLGDASIASPFTSKRSTIDSCLSVIEQGRCTLVTTTQMYSILALNCLISAYSLSVLTMDGVKFGDTQMTITGLCVASLFLFVTRSEPKPELSAKRPFKSIFNFYISFSLIGQTIIHIGIMFMSVQWAKPYTPIMDTKEMDAQFKPNVLNTVVFLISSTQTASTFMANYIGSPFMTDLFDNVGFIRTLAGLVALCILCALGIFSPLNYLMEVVDLPSWEFRFQLIGLMLGDVASTFLWERLCRFSFWTTPTSLMKIDPPEEWRTKYQELNEQQPKIMEERRTTRERPAGRRRRRRV